MSEGVLQQVIALGDDVIQHIDVGDLTYWSFVYHLFYFDTDGLMACHLTVASWASDAKEPKMTAVQSSRVARSTTFSNPIRLHVVVT